MLTSVGSVGSDSYQPVFLGSDTSSTPSPAEPPQDNAVRIDLSEEAKLVLAGANPSPQNSPQAPATLPDVVVQAISTRATAYEAYLRSQQPQGVPDYGGIARQVNQFYAQHYAQAGGAVAWVNSHVTVDPALLNDPVTAELVKQTKDQLAKLIYEAQVNPNGIVNGPGVTDLTGSQALALITSQTFELRAGAGVPFAFQQDNGDGTGTIVLYVQQLPGYYAPSGTSPAGQITTTLFHELGHAMLQQEFASVYNTFAQPLRDGGMSEPDIANAFNNSQLHQTNEQRATAMGHGLAELAGLGNLFNPTLLGFGEADR